MPFRLKNDFKKVFTGINPDDFEKVDLQESFFKELLDYSIERGYLNDLSGRFGESLKIDASRIKPMSWIQINRLPVNPSNSEDYDLLSRWQSALSALHAWGQKFVFLLTRHDGETNIFLGTESPSIDSNRNQAAEQMKYAISGSMPGIDTEIVPDKEMLSKINLKLASLKSVGAITGIPTFSQKGKAGVTQTLDPLAFGFHGKNGEKDYALMIVAEPIRDDEIANIISQYRSTGNSIHNFVKQTVTNSESESSNTNISVGAGAIIEKLLKFAGATAFAASVVATGGTTALFLPALKLAKSNSSSGGNAGMGGGVFVSRGYSNSISQGINTEYLNKFAQYSEELIDKHIERLKCGRNVGFWNVGTYVLGQSDGDVNAVMGMLRSIYSGNESFIEPIRLHSLKNDSAEFAPDKIVKMFRLLPLPSELQTNEDSIWHPLGKHYQKLSTPLNTEELSLATSLPRKDVPGLRFVKTVVRFANNPAQVETKDIISLGNIIDTGVAQKNTYDIDFNTLVKHTMISGTTGMGKSTTCRRIIDGVLRHNVPALILEPAKDEYVQWAIDYNKAIDRDNSLSSTEKERKKFKIFMPGAKQINGYMLDELHINPFEPASIKNVPIDMLSHSEQLVTILNASLPTSDVLPIIIDEAVYTCLKANYKNDFESGEMDQLDKYVKLDQLIIAATQVLKQRHYDQKVQDDLLAALKTRFEYLLRGRRGQLINTDKSTDFSILFNSNVVINLSKIRASKDKALIMSLIALALYEYRSSQFTYDAQYKAEAKKNKLLHMTVIEEAHNLLALPKADYGNSGNAQLISSEMFSDILSEIRAYGEGIMIVDQVPTKLIPDAIKNTNYKIVHRLVAPDDAELMAATLSLKGDQKDLISSLGTGETIIFGDKDDAAAWVKIKK